MIDDHVGLDDYLADVSSLHMHPVFLTQPGFMPAEPRSDIEPHNWRWEHVHPRMLAAATLLPVGATGADRRVLNLINPAITTGLGTTHTLTASIQLVLPGEVAPAHRHTPAALRFIIEGTGGFTTVDGERCPLSPGDLVLTPSWTWHDHWSESDGPIVWLDALDLPLVRSLEAIFYEEHSDERQAVVEAAARSVPGNAVGPDVVWGGPANSPTLAYRLATALAALDQTAPDPWEGRKVVYLNPETGGAVLPTMSCALQRFDPGTATRRRRHTSSTICHVVQGRGTTFVGEQRIDWAAHDTFVIPTWRWHHTTVTDDAEPGIVFSVSDEPAIRALALYRDDRVHSPVAV